MAETVTISTFLELRDNMSAGLQRIADALKAATKDAPKAQEALNNIAKQATANSRQVEKAKKDEERAAARAAEMRRRIQINSAKLNSAAAQKEVNDQIKAQNRIDSFERTREMNKIIREEQAAKQAQAMAFRAQQFETTREMNKIIRAERAAAKAMAAQARMDKEKERAAQRAAKNQEMLKERMAMAVVRTNQKLEAERKRAERQAEALARKEANAIIREAERAIREKRRIEREAASAARRSAQQADGGGLFGTMVSANVVANLLMRAASFAFDSIKNIAIRAIEVNVEYEKSISAISSAMYTMGASPSMRVAEAHAERVVGKLREMAAALPGEAAEYVEVFQRTIPGAFASGMKDSLKYANFVSKYTAVAIDRGISAKVAATNLQILMQGTARAGTKMAEVLSHYTGKSINEINRMSRSARFDLLQKAVDQAALGLEYTKDKADAIFGEFKSSMEDLYRMGGRPLFDITKLGVMQLNEWLKINKQAVIELGQAVSGVLGTAMLGIVKTAIQLASVIKAVTGVGTSTAKERTAATVAAELEEAKKPGLAYRIISKIPGFGSWQLASYMYRQGKVGVLEAELSKIQANTARLESAKTALATMTAAAPIDFSKSLEAIAEQAAQRYKAGYFAGKGKPASELFADYLEAMGVSREKGDVQKVWDMMMASGAVTPIGLAETPTGRAATINDFRYSRFDIRQEFAEGFDPDRIAVAFATDLGKLADRKLSAATGGPAVGAH